MDSLAIDLDQNDLEHLSQELDSELLNLIKQKRFYPCKYMRSFEKFKEKLPEIK